MHFHERHNFNGLSNAKVFSIGSDNAFSWLHEHHSFNELLNALQMVADHAFGTNMLIMLL